MSLTHYTNELIKIGVKYQIPSVVLKMIYDYNKNNYPNHFNVFMSSSDKLFKLNMKYCYKNDFYYNHKCAYCENCPICKKYLGIPNHYYCDKCNACTNLQKTHCNSCNLCYMPGYHKLCKLCNTCHNIDYIACEQCNRCSDLSDYIRTHKYCNTDHIYTIDDKINRINYYVNKFNNQQYSGSYNKLVLIIFRIGVDYIQNYYTNNDINNVNHFIIVAYDKLNEIIDRDLLSAKEQMLVCRFKSIVKKYVDNLD